ncbi:hypothetical protein BJY52DRAFT_1355770 [Lactarius psammicola]|nr:hypothetical protein BJY52DRAFT_1355770 [Lactarius psammicola]
MNHVWPIAVITTALNHGLYMVGRSQLHESKTSACRISFTRLNTARLEAQPRRHHWRIRDPCRLVSGQARADVARLFRDRAPLVNWLAGTAEGLQSSLDSPMTGSDHTSSSPESHSSLLLPPATPGLSCSRLSSPPDLGAAAEGEGITKAALHKERDALDPPSA